MASPTFLGGHQKPGRQHGRSAEASFTQILEIFVKYTQRRHTQSSDHEGLAAATPRVPYTAWDWLGSGDRIISSHKMLRGLAWTLTQSEGGSRKQQQQQRGERCSEASTLKSWKTV
jgi:hypothetical protein